MCVYICIDTYICCMNMYMNIYVGGKREQKHIGRCRQLKESRMSIPFTVLINFLVFKFCKIKSWKK